MQDISCGLDHCFLCRHCIPEWKEAIERRRQTFLFRKGKRLFSEGDKVEGIFFLYSGYVKIHTRWTDEKEIILRIARPGDVVGHRGLGAGDLYPISATALEDSKACFIGTDFLEATLKTNPSVTYKLMQFYATELQHAEKRMRELTHMEVKGRIAGALQEMSTLFGLDQDRFIAVTLTRQDIASYAGTTYETVFKFFNELIQGQVISTSGKSIRIENPETLKVYLNKSGL
jgi:CRP/FNR family transcriptional regulator